MTGLVLKSPRRNSLSCPSASQAQGDGKRLLRTKSPNACRLLKPHLLDLRVVFSIVAVKAAKMMRVSNLARGKAVLLEMW